MSIAERLRELADEIEEKLPDEDEDDPPSDAEKCLALVRNFMRYDGKQLRARQLEWVAPDGEPIVVKCDPPVAVRVDGLADVQVLEEYAICGWLVSVLEVRTDVRNVPGLRVPGLSSDDTDADVPDDFWTRDEDETAENAETVEEDLPGSPLTPTSRWALAGHDNYADDSTWFKGEDLAQMGERIDFISMRLTGGDE